MERHSDLFDEDDFNRPIVSARAYGREIALLLQKSDALREHVLRILERETADIHKSSLADAMNSTGCHSEYDLRFGSVAALLTGIREELGE